MRADDKTNMDWPHFDPVTVEAVIRELHGHFTPGMKINKRQYVRVMQQCMERYVKEGRPIITAAVHNRIEALMERQANVRAQEHWKAWIVYSLQNPPVSVVE